MANEQSLWHAEENDDQNDTVEDGCQLENPSPAQVLADKTANDWRKVVTIYHSHGVDTHSSTSLVEEEKVDDGDCPKSESYGKEPIEDAGDQKLCPGFGVRSSKN
jgi:hypothetical protein